MAPPTGWVVVAVGRLRGTPEATLFARYAARLHPSLACIEIAEGRGAPVEIRRREAQAMAAAIPAESLVIALDQGGVSPDSLALSGLLQRWSGQARRLTFLVGGAEGLDPGLTANAHATLSLGPLTWPHALARVMLAEQLYRAQTILAGHPYHRASRP